MCGIAGFLVNQENMADNQPGVYGLELLNSMGQAIAHRGPDAHGNYLDDYVGLRHQRLSIMDLSEAGNQPMFSDDQNVVIVFNGEIYNFLEIKEKLTA